VPTYQYACTDCGDRTEAVQKFTDDPLSVCTTCGGKLRKVFSPVGIVFKGSGFYRTDSRNGSSVPAGESKDGSKDKSKSSSESSSSASKSESSSSSDSSSSSSSSDKKASSSSSSGSKVA
jgi:putative FmdB family regulatory protein